MKDHSLILKESWFLWTTCVRFSGLFGSLHHSLIAWRILIFGWHYSSMIYILMWRIINLLHNFILSRRMYRRILISLFCTLNFNAKVFILPRPHHLLFWRWGFREDLMFFRLLFVKWLHFVDGLSLVIWFIFSLGGFVSFACRMIYILIGRICIIYSSYDLYSHWENLYHLAHRMIYILAWGICIIYCGKDSLTLCRF